MNITNYLTEMDTVGVILFSGPNKGGKKINASSCSLHSPSQQAVLELQNENLQWHI